MNTDRLKRSCFMLFLMSRLAYISGMVTAVACIVLSATAAAFSQIEPDQKTTITALAASAAALTAVSRLLDFEGRAELLRSMSRDLTTVLRDYQRARIDSEKAYRRVDRIRRRAPVGLCWAVLA